jgi:biopolymer transport protein ExbD
MKPDDQQLGPNQSGGSKSAQSLAQTVDANSIVVSVVSENEIYIGKVRIARGEIATEAERHLRLLPEERRIVYIKALPEVSYGVVVGVIDEIRALGYGIGLVKHKAQGQPATAVGSAHRTEPSEQSNGERSGTQAAGLDDDQLVVTVEAADRSGIRVKVGDTLVPLREIAGTVRASLKGRAKKRVMIVAPSTIQYGLITEVIDEIKAGGAEEVEFDVSSQAGVQTVPLKAQGISFTLPADWHKEDESTEADSSKFIWRGPDNTRFSLNISLHQPEYGNRSIEDETNSFYQDQRQGGSEDVRFLEIDGVRGVHFRRDWDWFDERSQPEMQKLIKWAAQRIDRGKRQIIFADLSSPARSFARHRATLYGILHSIKFTRN